MTNGQYSDQKLELSNKEIEWGMKKMKVEVEENL
jgi:hypothetical protein